MRLESILRDVGFGVRLCRRHKIVTAAALISLSFAIGACTAGLSLIVSMLSTSRTVLNLDLLQPTVYDLYQPNDAAVVQVRTRLDRGALVAILRGELSRPQPAFRLVDVTLQATLVDNTLGTRPDTRTTVAVLFRRGDRPRHRRTLWRAQLQPGATDTENWNPSGPGRAARASRHACQGQNRFRTRV
jgi:hypothetical protein